MSNVAIHVETQEEYDALMRYYEEVKGWKWVTGKLPTKADIGDKWRAYEKNTCIGFEDDFGFANLEYYTLAEYVIIPFKHLAAIEGIQVKTIETFKINDNYTATINRNKKVIVVDNTEVSFDTLNQLYTLYHNS